MSSPLFRFMRLTGLGAVAAFLFGLIRSARRQPTPPAQGTASWEPLVDDEPTPTRSGPVTFTTTATGDEDATADTEASTASAAEEAADEDTADEDAAPDGDTAEEAAPGDDAGAPAPQSFAGAAEDAAANDAPAAGGWVEPDEMGECPLSHPIKGNDQSKIFHVPGGMSYSRTKAERCYSDEATAEADGYRKAKR